MPAEAREEDMGDRGGPVVGTAGSQPWRRFYGSVPASLDYPEVTLYEALAATARRVPDAIAWDFLGTRSDYRTLLAQVDRCAAALAGAGLAAGDRFLISMPTTPQGVIAFYAAIRIGALPALIHPLSTAPEITHFLDATGARMALTLDAFYGAARGGEAAKTARDDHPRADRRLPCAVEEARLLADQGSKDRRGACGRRG